MKLRLLPALSLVLASGCTSVLGDDFVFGQSPTGAAGAGGGAIGAAGKGGTGGSAGTTGGSGGVSAGAGGVPSTGGAAGVGGNPGVGGMSGSAGASGTSPGGSGGTAGTSGGGGIAGTGGSAGTTGGDAGAAGSGGDAGSGGMGIGGSAGSGGEAGTAGSSGSAGAAGAGGGGGMCGNGQKDGAEDCDGSDLGGLNCTTAAGMQATGTLACTNGCAFDLTNCHFCGDGAKFGTEDCDGKDLGGATCMSEVSPESSGVVACNSDCTLDVSKCSVPTTCGNMTIDGAEKCDGPDFGMETCTTVIGKTAGGKLKCTAQCTFDSSSCTYCGDDAIQGSEQCDGATFGAASCASVTVHPGATGSLSCSAACTIETTGCAYCGDGKFETGEDCDASDLNGATCSSATGAAATGLLGCSSTCTFDKSKCQWCGDGKVNGSELCDASDLGGAGCATAVGMGSIGTLKCTPSCGYDVSGCTAPASCGNMVKDGTDQCDGIDLGGATCANVTGHSDASGTLSCSTNCTLVSTQCVYCGDGTKNNTESCDGADLAGGNCVTATGVSTALGTLGCQSDCSAFDKSGCYYCGDAKRNGSEACDTGDLGNQTCATATGVGAATGTLGCTSACGLDTSACTWCGNGKTDPGEICDGNSVGAATCASVVGAGSTGTVKCNSTCSQYDTSSCTAAMFCGNGNIDSGESCDGSNLNNKTCAQVVGVPGATGTLSCANNCQFVTSACRWCGNGIVDGSETCDTGDLAGATCTAPLVGAPVCKSNCTLDFSSCHCPANQVSCSAGKCTDLSNDPQNCGSCGRDCGAGNPCMGGVCIPVVVASGSIADFGMDSNGLYYLSTALPTGIHALVGGTNTVLSNSNLLVATNAMALDADNVYVAGGDPTSNMGYRVTQTARVGGMTTTVFGVAGGAGAVDIAAAGASLFWSTTKLGASPTTSLETSKIGGGGHSTLISETFAANIHGLAGRDDGSGVYTAFYGHGISLDAFKVGGGESILSFSENVSRVYFWSPIIYWTTTGSPGYVRAMYSDGSMKTLFTSQAGNLGFLVADDDSIYWSDFIAKKILTSSTDGSKQKTIADALGIPSRILIDKSYVYWLADRNTANSVIYRVAR